MLIAAIGFVKFVEPVSEISQAGELMSFQSFPTPFLNYFWSAKLRDLLNMGLVRFKLNSSTQYQLLLLPCAAWEMALDKPRSDHNRKVKMVINGDKIRLNYYQFIPHSVTSRVYWFCLLKISNSSSTYFQH